MQIEAMHEQNQQEKRNQLINCKRCDKKLINKQKKFCSKYCKNAWNTKHLYKYKYGQENRGRSPEKLIQDLLNKKQRKNLPLQYMIDLFYEQNGRCAISGIKLTHITGKGKIQTNISIDKIDPSKGYEIGNVQFVCFIVNIMKHTLNREDLLFWCRVILENNRD